MIAKINLIMIYALCVCLTLLGNDYVDIAMLFMGCTATVIHFRTIEKE